MLKASPLFMLVAAVNALYLQSDPKPSRKCRSYPYSYSEVCSQDRNKFSLKVSVHLHYPQTCLFLQLFSSFTVSLLNSAKIR